MSEEFEKTMTDGLRAIYKLLQDNNRLLERVTQFLEEESARKEAPNYPQHLEEFAKFDWASIGATVEKADEQGATIVNWKGKQFVRRSPTNKYGAVVFFSRCIGNDEQGAKKYERLCTFKSLDKVEIEPISDKAAKLIRT